MRNTDRWPLGVTLLVGAVVSCTGQIEQGGGGDTEPGGPGGSPTQPGAVEDPRAAPGAARPLPPAAMCGPEKSGIPRRVWRLTKIQYQNTVAVLFNGRQTATVRKVPPVSALITPFDAGNPTDRFSNESGSYNMNDSDLRSTLDSTSDVATLLVTKLRGKSCLSGPAKSPLPDCLKSLIEEKGAILFRRPLAPDEVASYRDLAVGSGLPDEEAAGLAFQAMLMAPQFLFRTEIGQGSANAQGLVKLGSFEVAAALSYSLTDFPPDEELWAAASASRLSAPAEVRAQALRLLQPLADQSTVTRFFREYLRYGGVTAVLKDAKDFPFHNPAGLLDDTERLVRDLLASNGKQDFIKTMLTSAVAYTRADTALSYGLPRTKTTPSDPQRTTLPAGQRAGLLTQPSFLAAFSTEEENQPVQRGRFISESLLCRPIPELPIDMIPPLPDLGPNATVRERLAVHTQGTCVGCHRLMDPLGLALEAYDHTGRFRTMEAGKPVNASGELTGAGAQDGPFNGPIELMQRLAASTVVRDCVARHSFRYWLGRPESEADACALSAAAAAYDAGRGDYAEMVAALFTSSSFLNRATK